MDTSGSIYSIQPSIRRLTDIVSHITSHGARPKVVVARNLGPDVMPILQQRDDLDVIVWPEDRRCDRKWLLEQLPGAAGVVVMLTEKVNNELLDAAGPSLRVVSTMSVGYEHVDLPELAKRKIRLGYTPDVLTDAVADLTVMLALMASRNVGETISVVQNGQWPNFDWAPFLFCGPQLSTIPYSPRRTVGFLGFGRISQATLARLIPFGITDCVYSSNPSSPPDTSRDTQLAETYKLKSLRRVDLDELTRESDFLFVLTPGGAATKHLVDETFLRKMKRTSILVNTSRGTVVDSEALARALREGWIWGAGLDVVEGEPRISLEHPLVKEPRCVILPHIASATLETRLGMATLAAQNAIGGVFGGPMPTEFNLQGV
ncbi:hypothetical protein BD779DRAFT_1629953 [Infundibulicybe gibba]|nr:hypothetical protein BD779DRAFT_1629953 [Infundibulicybe gibba]